MAARRPSSTCRPPLQEAIRISNNEDPLVVASLYREQAAKYTVEQIRGELLPTVQLQASYDDRFGSSKFVTEGETSIVRGTMTIPIYQAGDGLRAACARPSRTTSGYLQQIEQVRTEQQQIVVAAWAQLEAARAQLEFDKVAVQSNKVALQGVREEEKVGQRTLLDVLNAELEYLNSQVALETDRRNLVVAAYAVIERDGAARCGLDRGGVLRLRPGGALQGGAQQVAGAVDHARRRPQRGVRGGA